MDKIKNRPFVLKFTKENLEILEKFQVVHVSLVSPNHAYSIEFNKDGAVTLHEPHNSENGKVYTIDELMKLDIQERMEVMIL